MFSCGLIPFIPLINSALVIAVVLMFYLMVRRGRAPVLTFDGKSKVSKYLTSEIVSPHLNKMYIPSWFLFNGHLHTIFSSLVKRVGSCLPIVDLLDTPSTKSQLRREIVEVLPTCSQFYRGQVAIDWLSPSAHLQSDSPVLLLIPGLTGDSCSPYLQYVCRNLIGTQFRTVIVNYRGSGGVPLISPQMYCASFTDDLRQCVKYVEERYPSADLFAIGFSMGANILTKYLGEEGKKTPLDGAVAVSNPFDLVISSQCMHNSWLRKTLYSKGLTKSILILMQQ